MNIKLTKDYGTSYRTGDVAEFELGTAITLIENRRGEPADDKSKAEYDGVIRQRQRDAAAKAKRDVDEQKRREAKAKETSRIAAEKRKKLEEEERRKNAKKALAAAPANKQLKPAMTTSK
jgi:3-phenylpropionate/cinnamic acid dioxygenase small subunit